ncbi:hypothetical protein H2200_003212 [Cladophialophora chaetospira]|uniref:Uncharacterized protein n=1 Tax=Cladophialophora chaetospira TaxID=386627 RepID=A0AA38XGX8_9EURO|nr:hypothetical protein H2200_003212 [Cladophialophora chaetospira]
MATSRKVPSKSTSPSSTSSPSSDYFPPQKDPQNRSTSNQKTNEQSTASLAKVLAERSEILPQTMFGGLVDASSNLKKEPKPKQKLTWVKVEPGTK